MKRKAGFPKIQTMSSAVGFHVGEVNMDCGMISIRYVCGGANSPEKRYTAWARKLFENVENAVTCSDTSFMLLCQSSGVVDSHSLERGWEMKVGTQPQKMSIMHCVSEPRMVGGPGEQHV